MEEKNDSANISFIKLKKRQVGFSTVLWGVEIHIPWGAEECGVGNDTWPELTFVQKVCCVPPVPAVPTADGVRVSIRPVALRSEWLWNWVCPWIAGLGLTKERRKRLALSKGLTCRRDAEVPLYSVLPGFTSLGEGQKYIFPSSRLESWAP